MTVLLFKKSNEQNSYLSPGRLYFAYNFKVVSF